MVKSLAENQPSKDLASLYLDNIVVLIESLSPAEEELTSAPSQTAEDKQGEPEKERKGLNFLQKNPKEISDYIEQNLKEITDYNERTMKLWQKQFVGTFPNIWLHELDRTMLSILAFGLPGSIKVPWLYWAHDLQRNLVNAWMKLVYYSDRDVYAWKELTNLAPGVFLKTEMFEEGTLGKESQQECIAKKLTADDQEIGIVFNSFDLRHGIEYVHLNKRAMKLLGIESKDLGKPSKDRDGPGYRQSVVYETITPEAVKDALWLYYYGLDETSIARVDGAYYRQMILSELAKGLRNAISDEVKAEISKEQSPKDVERTNPKIFVVRPVKNEWIGDYPKTYNDVRDLETRVSFNGAYAGERDRVLLINRLVQENNCYLSEKYKIIDIVEFEPDRQYGYYGYLFEDQGLFDSSVTKFKEIMERNGYKSP